MVCDSCVPTSWYWGLRFSLVVACRLLQINNTSPLSFPCAHILPSWFNRIDAFGLEIKILFLEGDFRFLVRRMANILSLLLFGEKASLFVNPRVAR